MGERTQKGDTIRSASGRGWSYQRRCLIWSLLGRCLHMAETRNPGSGGGANCCRVPGLVERLGPQDSVDCRLESDSSGVARFAVEAECWQRAQERDYAGRKIAQVVLLCLAAIILFTLFLGVGNGERKREAIEAMREREKT